MPILLRNIFSLDEYWYVADAAERHAFVELLERKPRERVRALFGEERPYAPSPDGGNTSAADRELEERFNALFENDTIEDKGLATEFEKDDERPSRP